ncbi:MAG TPA: elongation factor Ts [Flavobacteriales bacterium]|nr:elongation factor Ts [Flavobacteriales bacterium]
MSNITAADVNNLRKQTGAGMMDCKSALVEANGDFEKAIDILRKKGQKVAAKRGDRDANEGLVLAKSVDGKNGFMIVLNCETDFVAKNEDFGNFANTILNIAIEKKPSSLEELKSLNYNGGSITIADKIIEEVGKIGEKIDLSAYEKVEASKVVAYNHPGNKLASMVGFNSESASEEMGKEVAMQVAAMNPVSIDKDDVSKDIIEREIEIGKEQAKLDGKPEAMLEKIALGKLNKFYQENTLMNQQFIKDSKKTVAQHIQSADKGLKVTAFKRIALG